MIIELNYCMFISYTQMYLRIYIKDISPTGESRERSTSLCLSQVGLLSSRHVSVCLMWVSRTIIKSLSVSGGSLELSSSLCLSHVGLSNYHQVSVCLMWVSRTIINSLSDSGGSREQSSPRHLHGRAVAVCGRHARLGATVSARHLRGTLHLRPARTTHVRVNGRLCRCQG